MCVPTLPNIFRGGGGIVSLSKMFYIKWLVLAQPWKNPELTKNVD